MAGLRGVCSGLVVLVVGCGPEGIVDVEAGTTEGASSTGQSGTGDGPVDGTSTGQPPQPSTGPGEGSGPEPACGNGMVDAGEHCEGDELAGSTCQSLFDYLGALSCTEQCTFDVSGCIPPGMVQIPAGEFWMGSDAYHDDERPTRKVGLSTYFIDAYEVTVAQYAECIAQGQCSVPHPGVDCNFGEPGRDDHPINCVDWFQASEYCEWAGGPQPKRLPTEAEWERAARGDDEGLYPWGDAPEPSCAHIVMNEGAGGGCGAWSSLPVGSRPAGDSPFGVHDMAGSIWNWVADVYAVYDVAEAQDPTGPATGTHRVMRGGGWDTVDLTWFRSSARFGHTPDTANRNIGFRCAVSPPVLP